MLNFGSIAYSYIAFRDSLIENKQLHNFIYRLKAAEVGIVEYVNKPLTRDKITTVFERIF